MSSAIMQSPMLLRNCCGTSALAASGFAMRCRFSNACRSENPTSCAVLRLRAR